MTRKQMKALAAALRKERGGSYQVKEVMVHLAAALDEVAEPERPVTYHRRGS